LPQNKSLKATKSHHKASSLKNENIFFFKAKHKMPQFWDITLRTHDVTGKLRRTKTTQIKVKEH
jgi:hypothetical protein